MAQAHSLAAISVAAAVPGMRRRKLLLVPIARFPCPMRFRSPQAAPPRTVASGFKLVPQICVVRDISGVGIRGSSIFPIAFVLSKSGCETIVRMVCTDGHRFGRCFLIEEPMTGVSDLKAVMQCVAQHT